MTKLANRKINHFQNKLDNFLRRHHGTFNDVKRTCEDYYHNGMTSGTYEINPSSGRLAPFKVECKVVGTRVYTVMHHDTEREQRAKDCEPKRCSITNVKYKLSICQRLILFDKKLLVRLSPLESKQSIEQACHRT
jgi:hypothetical protein